jgi:hypothetical protein
MITALLLAGCFAALAAPIALMMGGEDDETSDEATSSSESLEAFLEGTIDGEDILLSHDEEVVELGDFEPGSDTLELFVRNAETDFDDVALSGGGSALVLASEDEYLELRFPHLEVLPAGDIEVTFINTDGAEETTVPLTALLEGDILQPILDEPDVPTGEQLGDPLAPLIDDTDLPTDDQLTDDPLQPIMDEEMSVAGYVSKPEGPLARVLA